eukprot:TRINITY_DN8488_c0_g1_i2.p1 TRINITY_DN8488_c0_g1~~TRINITY_DN8488_c0_g1_i2.p1  ORF type:complete len:139 (+),score=32.10 TRINITY_DN8488_c0_g1_i2:55-417(+)
MCFRRRARVVPTYQIKIYGKKFLPHLPLFEIFDSTKLTCTSFCARAQSLTAVHGQLKTSFGNFDCSGYLNFSARRLSIDFLLNGTQEKIRLSIGEVSSEDVGRIHHNNRMLGLMTILSDY